MVTLAKYLWETGALIIFTLGSIHLYFTFFSNKFSSKNADVIQKMKTSYPILTSETTMWKAWIGFNASHSLGAIFFGAINIYLIQAYGDILQQDFLFSCINLIVLYYYLWLASKYWFSKPRMGILVACVLLTCSVLLTYWGEIA